MYLQLEEDGRLWATANPREYEACKLIISCTWDKTRQQFRYRRSYAALLQARAIFGPQLELSQELLEWELVARNWNDYLYTLTQLEDAPGDPALYDFQRVGVHWLLQANNCILGDEMGNGKTVQIAVALRDRLAAGGKAVVVAGKRACRYVWMPHLADWTDLRVSLVTGGMAARRKAFEADADVYVVSWDVLANHSRLAAYGNHALRRCPLHNGPRGEDEIPPHRCEAHLKELNLLEPDVVILDESHKMKDPSAKRTRAAWALLDQANTRWLMTGTPIANHPADGWALLRGIDKDSWSSRTHYIDRYCQQGWNPFGGLTITGLRPETDDEFHQLLDPIFLRRLKRNVPGKLPPVRRYAELGAKARREYNDMRDNLIAQIDSGLILAPNPLTNTIRLRQMAAGTLEIEVVQCPKCKGVAQDEECMKCGGTGEVDEVHIVEPSAKLDMLEEVLEELGDEPVVVFAEHRDLILLAKARLDKKGITNSVLIGGMTDDEADHAYFSWQDGKTRVMLMTIATGAESFTFVRANHTIYLQRSYSRLNDAQSEDRTDRIGQTEKTVYIDIITADTVEDRVHEALAEKGERFEQYVRDRNRLKELL